MAGLRYFRSRLRGKNHGRDEEDSPDFPELVNQGPLLPLSAALPPPLPEEPLSLPLLPVARDRCGGEERVGGLP
jgi:hypothetical protein